MNIRSIAAVLCLVIGAVLTIPATLAVWEERSVLNEDRFVETVQEVFEDEDVQNAVALRTTEVVMSELDIENRVDTAITDFGEDRENSILPGLTPLKGPLVQLAEDAIYRACVRILNSDALARVLETALRATHRSIMAFIEQDSDLVEADGDAIVLNLRPIIAEVILQVGGERALEAAAERADEDFGKIVLVEDRNDFLWTLIGYVDDISPIVPLASLLFLVLAVALSRDRLRMVGRIGAFLIVVAALVLLTLAVPVKELATSWPEREAGREAAAATYDILLDNFRNTQLLLGILGMALVGISVVSREPAALAAIRRVQPGAARPEDAQGIRTWARERITALRAAGLGVTALLLILWPDPSERVFLTLLLLAAAYFGLLFVIVSEAPVAFSLRSHLRGFFDPTGDLTPGTQLTWVGRWAGILRLVGIAVAMAAIIFAPDISYKILLFVVAAALLYLAAIDYFGSRSTDTGAHEV